MAARFDDMTAALGRFHAMNLDRIVSESRRLDQVVAHIDDGLVIFDECGRIERINPVAGAQLGIDAEGATAAAWISSSRCPSWPATSPPWSTAPTPR